MLCSHEKAVVGDWRFDNLKDQVMCRLVCKLTRNSEIVVFVLITSCTVNRLEISERLYLGSGEMAGVTRFLHFILSCI